MCLCLFGLSLQDVFRDASMAWHKRQSGLKQRRAEAAPSSAPTETPAGGWWNNVVSFEVNLGSRLVTLTYGAGKGSH